MNRSALALEGSLAALAAVILVLVSGWSLRGTFERQKRYALERLQKPALSMIERSYHLKDDLAIQQVVTALAQAPGVYFACVIGPDWKILAHSQPANVGQTYHRPDSPVTAHPLAEGEKRWGTFVISASEKGLWNSWRHEVTLWCSGGVFLWLAWVARSLFWRRRLAELEHRIDDVMVLAEDQKQKEFREAERQSRSRALWAAWLQSAVDQVPDGMVMLDQRQRVIAANALAAQRMHTGGQAIPFGVPWSDVPLLRSCGAWLEQSLSSPGIKVEGHLPADGGSLELTTLKNGSGTSVLIFPSKPVVK
jgi:PAS domain-containing protein